MWRKRLTKIFTRLINDRASQAIAFGFALIILIASGALPQFNLQATASSLSDFYTSSSAWQKYEFPGSTGYEFKDLGQSSVVLETIVAKSAASCSGEVKSGHLYAEIIGAPTDLSLEYLAEWLGLSGQLQITEGPLVFNQLFTLAEPQSCATFAGASLSWKFTTAEGSTQISALKLQNIRITFAEPIEFTAETVSIPTTRLNAGAKIRQEKNQTQTKREFRLQLLEPQEQFSAIVNESYSQLQVGDISIQGEVSKAGKKIDIQPKLTLLPTGELLVDVQQQAQTKPGKYTLTVSTNSSGETQSFSQDFYWGVLAVNTNKDVYYPGSDAQIWISVLDDEGYAVCRAEVEVVVYAPSGAQSVYSTKAGSVSLSDQCAPANFTYSHDFTAVQPNLTEQGKYLIEVRAQNGNGLRTARSSFIVDAAPRFSVARETASRIYPVHDYDVTVRVSNYVGFAGQIREYVPRVFDVYDTSAAVTEFGKDWWQLTWDVDWEAGREYALSYKYNPPDISPEFYLLGNLEIGSEYRELNAWQIASDAVDGPRSPGTGANNAAVGTAAWNNPGNILAADSNYSQVLLARNQISNYLQASNFGFSIPSGATINGIQVEILRREGGLGGNAYIRDSAVRIVKGGVVGATNRGATATNWPTSAAYASYGGAADLWGEAWTATDINAANFGVVLSATNIKVGGGPNNSEDAQVDHIRITINYTANNVDLRQQQYIWQEDDGTETTATSIAAQAMPITRARNLTTRLRFLIYNQGTLPAANYTYRLEYGANPGSCAGVVTWTAVPAVATTEHFQAAATANYANGAASTNVVGLLTDPVGTFSAGRLQSTTAQTAALTLNNGNFTEFEYNIQANNNATVGQTYCFRLTNAGSTTNFGYTVYPEVLIGQPNITQSHYRWRADNGDESTGQLLAGIIRPNADFTTNWVGVTPAGTHFSSIDEVVTAPAAGDTLDYISDDNNRADEFEMSTLTASTPYTRVDVSVYSRTLGNEELSVNLVVNGTPLTPQTIALTNSFAWYTVSFTGLSLSQADLDSLRVNLTQVRVGAADNVDVATMYASVYESGVAASWLAAEDTAFGVQPKLNNFRLRAQASNSGSIPKSVDLNLQYAARIGGVCGDDETFSNVTTSTAAAIYLHTSNFVNAGDDTSAQLTASGTFNPGKYLTALGTNHAATLNNGNYTELEFVLQAGVSAAGFYCFRIVDSGSAVNTYSVYPLIEIDPNLVPNTPSSLSQRTTGNVTLAEGSWLNATTVRFAASASDSDNPENLRLCVEAQPIATPFTNVSTGCSGYSAYSGAPISLTLDLAGLAAGEYHWQARIEDDGGLFSSWVSFGTNTESVRDFGIDLTAPAVGVVRDGLVIGADYDQNAGELDRIEGHWAGVVESESGIAGYEYALGTSAGATDIVGWSAVAPAGTLFNAGFESANLSEWDAAVTDAGDLSVSYLESAQGLYSLSALIDDANTLSVSKNFVSSGQAYARLLLNPSSLSMGGGDTFVVAELQQAGSPRAQIELNFDGSNFRARGVAQPSAISTAWVNLAAGAWNTLEIHWLAASSVNLELWANSTLVTTAPINTAGQSVDSLQAGALSGLDAGTSGTFYLDSFALSDSSQNNILEAFSEIVSAPGHLRTGQQYFVSVRALDNAGNMGSGVSADGFTVLPVFSFSTSANSLNFINLNPANSWTDSQSVNLQASTNAYGGYIVRSYATGPFTNTLAPALTIPNFSGSNLAPILWAGSGFGYTTSDSNLSGGTANRFTSGGPNFAGLSTAAPGDITADHTTNITGSTGPVLNQIFNLTYRVSADGSQAAGPYSTEIIYEATPIF